MHASSAAAAVSSMVAASASALVRRLSWMPSPQQQVRCQPGVRHRFLDIVRGAPWIDLPALYASHAQATAVGHGIRLEIDVERSKLKLEAPVEFRMVATRLLPRGSLVTFYGGVPIHKLDYRRHKLQLTHARAIPATDWALDGLPLSQMLRRPVPKTLPELELAALPHRMAEYEPRVLSCSAQFTPAEVQLWRDTPMGYMINTADVGQENNLTVKHVAFAHKTCEIPALYATRDIFPGEELLSPYGRPF